MSAWKVFERAGYSIRRGPLHHDGKAVTQIIFNGEVVSLLERPTTFEEMLGERERWAQNELELDKKLKE